MIEVLMTKEEIEKLEYLNIKHEIIEKYPNQILIKMKKQDLQNAKKIGVI